MAIIFGDPPYAGLYFDSTMLEDFIAAGILMVEDKVPPVPLDWPLIDWVRQHVDEVAFRHAVERGRKMTPAERGQYLTKALDDKCDG